MTATHELRQQKQRFRQLAFANRQSQQDKDSLSHRILARLTALPEYQQAETAMFYVDVRSEVRTRSSLETALLGGKRIVVPYCAGDELGLFHLEAMDELEIRTFGILEPRDRLRALPEKQVNARELDVILVPGVAFDRRGGRLGHGRGYYDRLLRDARPDTPLVALAFDCQLFPEIPTEEHDVFMDKIITENEICDNCLGRAENNSNSSAPDASPEA